MRTGIRSKAKRSSYAIGALIFMCLVIPMPLQAQNGDNAICTSATGCDAARTPSPAFLDASSIALGHTNNDLCAIIYKMLHGDFATYVQGEVIDARGISGSAALTCASGTSPWYNGATYLSNKPSAILLPPGVIQISYQWILPSGTRLIGEGTSTGTNSGGPEQTVIKACSATNCFSGNAMLQFGSSACPTSPCTGIAVEHLTLNGNNQTNTSGQAIAGIENANAQEQSYVDDVTLFQILGTGLYIHGSAQNSGPYSNIVYDTNGAASSTAACVSIQSVSGGTRGVHGLKCKSGNYSTAGIYLDSSDNSIEDVQILGFDDGILIGSQAPAQGNVLLNVLGDTDRASLSPINVIHISSNNFVGDLTISAVSNQGSGGVTTIQDDATSTTLGAGDATVAMYVLGKQSSGGYTRFTTSPNAATWAFGTSAPVGTGCPPGSLYSVTSASSQPLYLCQYLSGSSSWHAVPVH